MEEITLKNSKAFILSVTFSICFIRTWEKDLSKYMCAWFKSWKRIRRSSSIKMLWWKKFNITSTHFSSKNSHFILFSFVNCKVSFPPNSNIEAKKPLLKTNKLFIASNSTPSLEITFKSKKKRVPFISCKFDKNNSLKELGGRNSTTSSTSSSNTFVWGYSLSPISSSVSSKTPEPPKRSLIFNPPLCTKYFFRNPISEISGHSISSKQSLVDLDLKSFFFDSSVLSPTLPQRAETIWSEKIFSPKHSIPSFPVLNESGIFKTRVPFIFISS